jgi:hypothetical protein
MSESAPGAARHRRPDRRRAGVDHEGRPGRNGRQRTGKKGCPVFEEFDRGLVLNKTNSRQIAALYGSETKTWKGKKITLYRSETSFQNKTVNCVRVRDTRPE